MTRVATPVPIRTETEDRGYVILSLARPFEWRPASPYELPAETQASRLHAGPRVDPERSDRDADPAEQRIIEGRPAGRMVRRRDRVDGSASEGLSKPGEGRGSNGIDLARYTEA